MSPVSLKTIRLSVSIRFGIWSLLIYVCVFFLLVLGMYLFNFNSSHTKGYDLTRLERDRQSLLLKTEQQRLAISEARALASVKARAVQRSMIKNENPLYMRLDTAVAKR